MKKIILLCLLISHASSLFSEETAPSNEQWVTIFVHGIISIKPYLTVSNIIRFLRDDISNTVYEKSVRLTRKDDFFYQYHAMQDMGLRPIDLACYEKGYAAGIIARSFDAIAQFSNPAMPENLYYTFGWSGLLSQRLWTLEAQIFYQDLEALVQEIRAKGKEPRLRLVCYSHGGNFALRLALFDSCTFHIDELWLIGVPILPESYELADCSIFKKIDNFYSEADRIQRLDIFCSQIIFSDRAFYSSRVRQLSPKITQVKMKFRRSSTKLCTKKKCGTNRECVDKFRSRKRNADPGHSELWSLGWSPTSYRENFPLHPLPATVCLPLFSNAMRTADAQGCHGSVEVHFDHEYIVVHVPRRKRMCLPFLPIDLLHTLRSDALAYQPDCFNTKIFDDRICQIIKEATEELDAQKYAANC
jgi:hypothetical protein